MTIFGIALFAVLVGATGALLTALIIVQSRKRLIQTLRRRLTEQDQLFKDLKQQVRCDR